MARDDASGDNAVFWCAALAICCGALASAAAAYGCANQVLALFTPKLSWLLLAPSFFAVLVGLVGLCASRRAASKLLSLQFAGFVLLVAVVLAGTGAFVVVSSGTTASWVQDGCAGFRSTALWAKAGRIESEMEMVHSQYKELHCGWERCRALNPLVYDLADCGVRAQCSGERDAEDVPLFGWFQHLQISLACGGFCTHAVPLFGSISMRDTIPAKPACAPRAAESIEALGVILGAVAGLVAVPLAVGALALFCVAGAADDGFQELDSSDPDDDFDYEATLQSGRHSPSEFDARRIEDGRWHVAQDALRFGGGYVKNGG
jgi:hypothetical protein